MSIYDRINKVEVEKVRTLHFKAFVDTYKPLANYEMKPVVFFFLYFKIIAQNLLLHKYDFNILFMMI